MSHMFEFGIAEKQLIDGLFTKSSVKAYVLTIRWTPEFKEKNPCCERLRDFPGNSTRGFTCAIITTHTRKELHDIFTALQEAGVVLGQAYEPYAVHRVTVSKNRICFYKPGTDLRAVHDEIVRSAEFNGGIDFSSEYELMKPRSSELGADMRHVEENDEFLEQLQQKISEMSILRP
jgi:hypothetical protein